MRGYLSHWSGRLTMVASRSAAKKAPPAKKPVKKPTPAKKPAPPPAKKSPPAKAGKKSPAAKPTKTIVKKLPPPSALSERKKSKGRAIKEKEVFEFPEPDAKTKKAPAKKPAPVDSNKAKVKDALKKVTTILTECIKML